MPAALQPHWRECLHLYTINWQCKAASLEFQMLGHDRCKKYHYSCLHMLCLTAFLGQHTSFSNSQHLQFSSSTVCQWKIVEQLVAGSYMCSAVPGSVREFISRKWAFRKWIGVSRVAKKVLGPSIWVLALQEQGTPHKVWNLVWGVFIHICIGHNLFRDSWWITYWDMNFLHYWVLKKMCHSKKAMDIT